MTEENFEKAKKIRTKLEKIEDLKIILGCKDLKIFITFCKTQHVRFELDDNSITKPIKESTASFLFHYVKARIEKCETDLRDELNDL